MRRSAPIPAIRALPSPPNCQRSTSPKRFRRRHRPDRRSARRRNDRRPGRHRFSCGTSRQTAAPTADGDAGEQTKNTAAGNGHGRDEVTKACARIWRGLPVELAQIERACAEILMHYTDYTRLESRLGRSFLDFRGSRGFNPPQFSERLSFRPAARPLRPEANARQRDAPSGAKVFGNSAPAGRTDRITA